MINISITWTLRPCYTIKTKGLGNMKKAKLIISILFILLIVVEICIGTYAVYCDYMQETENLGVALLYISASIYGTLILISELEIWHVILYFVSNKKRKRVYKTILNSIESILAVGILFFTLNEFLHFLPYDPFDNTIGWVWSIITIIYISVKFIHFIVWAIKEA